MTTAAPTFAQIKAQVATILTKAASGDAIAIRTLGRWTGEPQHWQGSQCYRIYQCDSPLALRLALRDPVDAAVIKVCLTPLNEDEIEEDIRLRLIKRQLFPLNSWQVVKSLFGAHTIDPRLLQHRWIADTLIDGLPHLTYPSVMGGFLDAEVVWPILLEQGMGLADPRPDLASLLVWSTLPDPIARYQALPPDFRDAATAWLTETVGAAAQWVLTCAFACPDPDALPLGLAAEVLFHPTVGHQLDRAVGKMEERFLGGLTPTPQIMLQWSRAATTVIQRGLISPEQQTQLLQRADSILTDLGAEKFMQLSTTSEAGFQHRLSQLGTRLIALLATPQLVALEAVQEAYQAIATHRYAQKPAHQRRLERAEMAVRLARWWVQTGQTPFSAGSSLDEAMQFHALEGSFLDWARLTLRAGDPNSTLSRAYKTLFDRITTQREQHAQHFATCLTQWLDGGTERPDWYPIETILSQLVAPLASQSPVLVIVLDGMSMAVCRDLLSTLVSPDWVAIAPSGTTTALMPGLATLPSITTTSRTSLLCGTLTQGNQTTEQTGFAAHPALRKVCRTGHPPRLFHKAALQDGTDAALSTEVREAIKDPQTKVVGVVVNAIDDYLAKGEQLDISWSEQSINLLSPLLHEAHLAERYVLLLSDHGHVLDTDMTYQAAEGGERWRSNPQPPNSQELTISGSRVLLPETQTLVAPWSEKIRYAPKKTGYHGGLNPQEMIVPIVALSARNRCPKGWQEAPIDIPIWWEDALEIILPSETHTTSAPQAPDHSHLGPLFSLLPDPSALQPEATPTVSTWIDSLIQTSSYQAQKQAAGRLAPDDSLVSHVLMIFEQSDYQLKFTVLARLLQQSPTQLREVLLSLQRVLNIDGYPILLVDQSTESVSLNQPLLVKQFIAQ